MKTKLFSRTGLIGLLAYAAILPDCYANDVELERAQDLSYGEVLYEYHQGRSFEALSLLSVAKEKGGIANHGDHPSLVEGGLMLAYGMTREAKSKFEEVLEDKVSPESRNAAWFYLGKVFYLEQDFEASFRSLNKVDGRLLAESKPELYREWRYLIQQIQFVHGIGLESGEDQEAKNSNQNADSTIDSSLWTFYVTYNQSVMSFDADPQAALKTLEELSAVIKSQLRLMKEQGMMDDGELSEYQALLDRSYLTIGQWHLQRQKYDKAKAALENISLYSMFSDQALFQFSVASTHLEQYGLALEALTTLQSRESFTPWLQQVPYALAYLYEQMDELSLALQAYQAAGEHYENRLGEIDSLNLGLSEDLILSALQFDQSITDGITSAEASFVKLGVDSILNDAYGHIRVQPSDYSFAYLLSLESFQIGLRDLHELYKLKNSLSRWDKQLDSFGVMLETRGTQRAMRVEETDAALAAQNAGQWQSLQKAYSQQINKALAEEDAAFFMDEEQRDLKEVIDGVYANLALLPDDADKAEYKEKIDRMNAYFLWWIADRYGVNRWAAEKELRELNFAMEEFGKRRAVLQSELASDEKHQIFAKRISDGKQRLLALATGIDQALAEARDTLIQIVKEELDRQKQETFQYLVVSREAEARLADVLYQGGVDRESGIQQSTPASKDIETDNNSVMPEDQEDNSKTDNDEASQ